MWNRGECSSVKLDRTHHHDTSFVREFRADPTRSLHLPAAFSINCKCPGPQRWAGVTEKCPFAAVIRHVHLTTNPNLQVHLVSSVSSLSHSLSLFSSSLCFLPAVLRICFPFVRSFAHIIFHLAWCCLNLFLANMHSSSTLLSLAALLASVNAHGVILSAQGINGSPSSVGFKGKGDG